MRMKYRKLKNVEGKRSCRKLTKTNKNHYPDPEWVWTQIENNESPAVIYEKMDVKYALNAHGNLGKKQNRKKK